MAIVGTGGATEEDLRRRLTGFRDFATTGGYSGPDWVPSPQTWFALHQDGEAYWSREWAAVPTKAEQRMAENIDSTQQWLREQEERDRATG